MSQENKKGNSLSKLTNGAGAQQIMIIAVIIILTIFFSIKSDSFAKYTTFVTMSNFMYYILLMAIGVTFPLITGGVDLSMGTGLVCYAIVGSYLMNFLGLPVGVAIIVTLLMSVLIGFINGMVVAKLEVPPFIATLCTMMIARGMGSILTGGKTGVWPMAGQEGGWVRNIFKITVGDTIIPIGLVWMLVALVVMTIVLRKTMVGRYIIAIGSNKEALRLSGVNVLVWHVMAYVISGFFVGLASIAYACTFSSITPGTGAGFELDAIGAVIIGGTSPTGGSGTIFGTFLGVILISLLKTGLPFIGLQANWQQIITGLILLGAVTIDVAKRRRAE